MFRDESSSCHKLAAKTIFFNVTCSSMLFFLALPSEHGAWSVNFRGMRKQKGMKLAIKSRTQNKHKQTHTNTNPTNTNQSFFSCIAERARSLVGQLRGKLLQKKVKPVTARVFTSCNQEQQPDKKHTQNKPKQTKHNTASENSQKVKLNAPPQAPHFVSSTM